MAVVGLIYPHQLDAEPPAAESADHLLLVEDPLYFTHYPFHRQKLMLHRATMTQAAARYTKAYPKAKVRHVESKELKSTADIVPMLAKLKATRVQVTDLCDDWLTRKLATALTVAKLPLTVLDDNHFLTPFACCDELVGTKKKLFFTDFYIKQRKRLGILLDDDGTPEGGQWSFDAENRKKLPVGVAIPTIEFPKESDAVIEARAYQRKHFPKHYGDDAEFRYPTTPMEAQAWLVNFLERRLENFGAYEDAISRRGSILFHSVLTPMLNTGLLRPETVVQAALAYRGQVPLNSLEGFLRQIIGWREFIRLVYLKHGRVQRTTNYWGFTRPIPKAFYDGSTGITPVDDAIKEALRTGYCHHIERLMILGNFLLLCEVHPDAVFQWFMELFIDAYDWVMVPNVYGMSQYADGGLMTTKPYISGSAYVLKMSDHKKGPWCPIWDALYWRFIDKQSAFFAGNPRMSMMVAMKNKLGAKLTEHHRVAEAFLKSLDEGGTHA